MGVQAIGADSFGEMSLIEYYDWRAFFHTQAQKAGSAAALAKMRREEF